MELTLSEAELERITGYRYPAWQRRWLKDHKWRFDQDRLGRPIVARAYYLQRQGVTAPDARTSAEPNWEAAGSKFGLYINVI